MIWCSVMGCVQQATHHLFWQVRPRHARRDQRGILAGILPLPLCEHHAIRARADSGLFSEATWQLVLDEARKRRLPEPDLEDVEIYPRPGVPATASSN